jgi:hypothetical protein
LTSSPANIQEEEPSLPSFTPTNANRVVPELLDNRDLDYVTRLTSAPADAQEEEPSLPSNIEKMVDAATKAKLIKMKIEEMNIVKDRKKTVSLISEKNESRKTITKNFRAAIEGKIVCKLRPGSLRADGDDTLLAAVECYHDQDHSKHGRYISKGDTMFALWPAMPENMCSTCYGVVGEYLLRCDSINNPYAISTAQHIGVKPNQVSYMIKNDLARKICFQGDPVPGIGKRRYNSKGARSKIMSISRIITAFTKDKNIKIYTQGSVHKLTPSRLDYEDTRRWVLTGEQRGRGEKIDLDSTQNWYNFIEGFPP